MVIEGSAISCGVYQIFSVYNATLQELKNVLREFKGEWEEARSEYDEDTNTVTYPKTVDGLTFVFSDVVREDKGGTKLVRFIKDYDLGTVTATLPDGHKNPNTTNNIQLWVWLWNGNIPKTVRKREAV